MYLEAAEIISEISSGFGCTILRGLYDDIYDEYFIRVEDKFPEFMLFKPRETAYVWFDNQDERVNALLLSAEMCK